jgi:hypothetical protein
MTKRYYCDACGKESTNSRRGIEEDKSGIQYDLCEECWQEIYDLIMKKVAQKPVLASESKPGYKVAEVCMCSHTKEDHNFTTYSHHCNIFGCGCRDYKKLATGMLP